MATVGISRDRSNVEYGDGGIGLTLNWVYGGEKMFSFIISYGQGFSSLQLNVYIP